MQPYDRKNRRPLWQLRNCRCTSEQAGMCHCCGLPVSEVHLLTALQTYQRDDGTEGLAAISGALGHRQCLATLTQWH